VRRPRPLLGPQLDARVGPTLALAAGDVVVALGLQRLLTGHSWIPAILVVLALTQALGWLGRRRGWSTLPAVVLGVVATALVTTWFVFPGTLAGIVPTLATVHHAARSLASLPSEIRSDPVPAPVSAGFELLAVGGTGLAVTFSDWSAFRADQTFVPLAPSFALLVVTGGAGTHHHQILEAATWTAAALAYLALRHPPRRPEVASRRSGAPGLPRLTEPPASRPAVVAATGTILAACAVGAVLGPLLPGAGAKGAFHWHRGLSGGSARIAFSPLVDIRTERLSPSSAVAFLVASPIPSYWQMTTLDHFNGESWTANQTYQPNVAASGAATSSVIVAQHFDLQGLDSDWLPAAPVPVSISGIADIAYDPASGSLLAPGPEPSGTTYTVLSAVPELTVRDLSEVRNRQIPASVRSDLQLPSGIPGSVARLARRITAHATTPYAKALALEEFFRHNFHYSLDVAPTNSTNAMVDFLFNTRTGYCQQFAGTYAVMARMVGLPSRVAVGFTTGEELGPGEYLVRSLNAHAWPEVWLGRYGWVSFEPTPGRGEPGAVNYTHAPPGQAQPTTATGRGETVAPPTTNLFRFHHFSSTGTSRPGGHLRIDGQRTTRRTTATTAAASTGSGSGEAWGIGIGVLAGLLVLLGLGAVLIDRRRQRLLPEAAAVSWAWHRAASELAAAGLARRAAETPLAYARRVGPRLGPAATDALGRLAAASMRATYARNSELGSSTSSLLADAASVTRAARARLTRRQRLLRHVAAGRLLASFGAKQSAHTSTSRSRIAGARASDGEPTVRQPGLPGIARRRRSLGRPSGNPRGRRGSGRRPGGSAPGAGSPWSRPSVGRLEPTEATPRTGD